MFISTQSALRPSRIAFDCLEAAVNETIKKSRLAHAGGFTPDGTVSRILVLVIGILQKSATNINKFSIFRGQTNRYLHHSPKEMVKLESQTPNRYDQLSSDFIADISCDMEV